MGGLVKITKETSANPSAFARALPDIYKERGSLLHGFIERAGVTLQDAVVDWKHAGPISPVYDEGDLDYDGPGTISSIQLGRRTQVIGMENITNYRHISLLLRFLGRLFLTNVCIVLIVPTWATLTGPVVESHR